MNAEDLLIKTLETFGFPVRRQGSLLVKEKYPDSFFTFWNSGSNSDRYYDNKDHALISEFDVNFYSCDPDAVYTVLREAIKKLKATGFIISGDGHDVASDEQTHDGRGVSCAYVGKITD